MGLQPNPVQLGISNRRWTLLVLPMAGCRPAHNRLEFQFHWDRCGKADAGSSCWIRVSQPWAGGSFGGMAIPRIGHEVIVEFIEADPDRPIINGRVYNGKNMAHPSNAGRENNPARESKAKARELREVKAQNRTTNSQAPSP